MNLLSVILVFLTVAGISVSAVLAFWWAGKSGQFQVVESGAMEIFDADEINAGNIQPEAKPSDYSL
jgi:cbb3-type cytochrome oxidase maturation protein